MAKTAPNRALCTATEVFREFLIWTAQSAPAGAAALDHWKDVESDDGFGDGK
jgi:hypothetical protein